jgi:hypothetical protein
VDHVLWIGGPPASGKTTVARRLARRHGLRLYSADATTWAHIDRLRATSEAARAWHELPPDERWAGQDPVARSLYFERGPLILEDLRALPRAPLVLAEGSALPAAAADPARSVWLIPSTAVQDERLDARGTTGGRARLDRALRDLIAREAAAAGLPVLDGSGDVLAQVEQRFAAPLAAGPGPGDRAALARAENQAIAAQVRGYHARPWTEGDPEAVVYDFVCECGEPGCDAVLRVPVGAAAAAAVIAPGH